MSNVCHRILKTPERYYNFKFDKLIEYNIRFFSCFIFLGKIEYHAAFGRNKIGKIQSIVFLTSAYLNYLLNP